MIYEMKESFVTLVIRMDMKFNGPVGGMGSPTMLVMEEKIVSWVMSVDGMISIVLD